MVSSLYQLSFSNYEWILLAAILAAILNNGFWFLGIIGSFDFSGSNSGSTVQNLEYAIQHGSPWGGRLIQLQFIPFLIALLTLVVLEWHYLC
nr:hypothetical protein [Liquorilactobacillus satsumensis]